VAAELAQCASRPAPAITRTPDTAQDRVVPRSQHLCFSDDSVLLACVESSGVFPFLSAAANLRVRVVPWDTGVAVPRDALELLVRRAQDGERDALEELLRRYGDRVRVAIRQRLSPQLRRRFETEDVFQSSVAVTLEDLRGLQFRGEREFISWLRTIAERRLLSAARRHHAARRDVRCEERLEDPDAVPAGHTTPPERAERAEAQAEIERAIARLPAEERRVIRLRSYEGLPFREIAENMGLSNKHAARDLYLRALKRMGELVDSDPSPPEA